MILDCKTVRIFALRRETVKQKAWNKAENRERDGRVRLARVGLLRHALPIF